ncbi:MAG: 2-alkenal reductase [Ignavibacteriales bacterium CG12_big_fil_rev_8_21_14_0_65_30_8]|nr:MAG: 2-alkenal reductase [Ignavibacteriales bacterium CG12_big_fil_rev_8_21_14_0_65_30_8]
MRNKTRFFYLLIIIILFASIFYIYQTKQNGPYFYKSDAIPTPIPNTSQPKEEITNEITNDRNNVITNAVKEVSPAVVGINVIEIRKFQNPYSPFYNDPFFRQFFGNSGTYNQKVKELGSGYIVSSDGYIVTNDHVAGNASQITVTLTNGKNYSAKLVGTDHATDISLLKINGNNFPTVKLGNSENIIIGEWVVALGNPFGLFSLNNKPTVTVGVISSVGLNLQPISQRYYLNMIQTDAAINGGNSGGPLVNSLGEVIGMNTLIFTAGSQGNIGLGFAIPINKVKRIIKELKEKGKVNRNFDVGLGIQSIDEGIARAYNLASTKGVIITQVIRNSPADKSGLKVGDIIVQVQKYNINDEETLISVFQEFRAGDVINIIVLRNSKRISLKMKLEKI